MLLKWHTTWDKHRFERQTTNDYIFYQFVCLALAHSFSLSLRAYSHFSKRIIKFEMMSGCLRFVSAALWQHAIMPQRHTNGRQSVCGDSESNKKAGCRSLTTYAIPLQSSSIAHWTDRHTHSTQNTHTRAHRVHTHFINKLQVPGKTLSMHWGSKRTITILQNNLMIIYYYYHWIISLPSWLLVDDNDDDDDNRAEPMQINNIRVCYVCYALRPSAAVRLCVCARDVRLSLKWQIVLVHFVCHCNCGRVEALYGHISLCSIFLFLSSFCSVLFECASLIQLVGWLVCPLLHPHLEKIYENCRVFPFFFLL